LLTSQMVVHGKWIPVVCKRFPPSPYNVTGQCPLSAVGGTFSDRRFA
jgi:hypothetical protein